MAKRLKDQLIEWFRSADGKKWLADIASIVIGAIVMVLLCGGMSIYIAWHAPSMTDICRKCGCSGAGKPGARAEGVARPSAKVKAAR